MADIAIRMMTTGDVPRQQPKSEPRQVGQIITEVVQDDTPFMDIDELQDPRLRMWREVLRQRYKSKHQKKNDQEN